MYEYHSLAKINFYDFPVRQFFYFLIEISPKAAGFFRETKDLLLKQLVI